MPRQHHHVSHLISNALLRSPLRLLILLAIASPVFGQPYYVAPAGNDANSGTLAKPFASLQRARVAVRKKPGTVFLRGGTYYLPQTIIFTAEDSGTKKVPIVYQAYKSEHPVISGGVKLDKLDWQPWQGGIFRAGVPEDFQTEELDAPDEWFLNAKTHTLYFYPPAGLDLKKATIEATRSRRRRFCPVQSPR